jgi:hypothetical protein
MRRPHVRTQIDGLIDWVRFQLDTFPRPAYQPLPQVNKRSAPRADGVHSRWAAIGTVLDDLKPESGLDIGSQVGYFALSMAQRGIATIAVEMEPRSYRTLLQVRDRLGLTNLGVLVLQLAPDNVGMLPPADVTVFMSVWHHMVRWHGEAAARSMLRAIWARTAKAMIFETGEAEMPAVFGLPDLGPDPRRWIASMLEQECADGTAQFLGLHVAYDPDRRPCRRHLFAVVRAAH